MSGDFRTPAIEISGLTKAFGATKALDGVDLAVPEGSVFGFLGPNGAGKTTTLRILTGMARATSGSARIFGRDVSESAVRSMMGFLPDVPGFYPWMTAEEFLRFSGGLFGLGGAALDERVTVLLDLAGLSGVTSKVGGFSRGMKQRLGVAQALVNAPRLLMLDEPTSALDPLGRKEVLDMIASLAGRTTVFFSTHILADVERVCDRVAILDHGRLVAQAEVDDLKQRYGAHRLVVDVDSRASELAARLGGRPWATRAEVESDGSIALTVADVDAAQRDVPKIVAEEGLALRRFEGGEVTLEIYEYPTDEREEPMREMVFSYTGDVLEVCEAFAATFEQLYEDRDTDEFEFNWRQPFPLREFEEFKKSVRG